MKWELAFRHNNTHRDFIGHIYWSGRHLERSQIFSPFIGFAISAGPLTGGTVVNLNPTVREITWTNVYEGGGNYPFRAQHNFNQTKATNDSHSFMCNYRIVKHAGNSGTKRITVSYRAPYYENFENRLITTPNVTLTLNYNN